MSTNTATVETLTAEVRALMIGSRQVTLSVYRQLDEVPWDANFSPFGRVRDKEDEKSRVPYDDHYNVLPGPIFGVGRGAGGQLVRAVITKPSNVGYSDEFEHWWLHDTLGAGRGTVIVAEGRYKVRFSADLGWEGRYKSMRESAEATSSHCTNVKAIAERSPVAGMDRWDFTGEDRGIFDWLAAEYNHRWLSGEFCKMYALESTWREEAEEWLIKFTAMADRYRAAENLPLIVLAGMR